MRHRLGLTLAAVAVCVACTSDEQAGPPLAPLAPTSSAPSPSVSAFPETPQGAADFVKELNGALNTAYGERDPEVVRRYFTDGCEACANYLESLEALQSGEITIQGGQSTLLAAESPGGSGPVTVVLRIDYEGAVFTDRSGTVTSREPPSELTSEVSLERRSGSWLVTAITATGRG